MSRRRSQHTRQCRLYNAAIKRKERGHPKEGDGDIIALKRQCSHTSHQGSRRAPKPRPPKEPKQQPVAAPRPAPAPAPPPAPAAPPFIMVGPPRPPERILYDLDWGAEIVGPPAPRTHGSCECERMTQGQKCPACRELKSRARGVIDGSTMLERWVRRWDRPYFPEPARPSEPVPPAHLGAFLCAIPGALVHLPLWAIRRTLRHGWGLLKWGWREATRPEKSPT